MKAARRIERTTPVWCERVMRTSAILAALAFLVLFTAKAPAQDREQAPANAVHHIPGYTDDIQPIFNKRCIACHGCLGSPCNLKLTSFRGLDRGGFGQNPYSSHLESYARTDLNVVQTTEEWRARGFYPVLSRNGSKEENLSRSMLIQMVEAGEKHNTPGFSRKALMPLYAKRY